MKNTRRIYILWILLAASCFLQGQTKQEYALYLMKDKDYFRAISEYKELSFFSKNIDSTIFYTMQIGRSYRMVGKYELSNETFGWLQHDFALPPALKCRTMLNLGYNCLALNDTIKALRYFNGAALEDSVSPAYLLKGLYYCKVHNWDKAEEMYDRSKKRIADKTYFDAVKILGETTDKARNISSRSRLISVALSAILPGAGQIYCGHYADGFQAITFVSTFAYMSYLANKYDVSHGRSRTNTYISLSLTSMFYIANLFGADRTADYYNQKQNVDMFEGINSVMGKLNF